MKDAKIQGGAVIWARKTIESDIFHKPAHWFKIWFYLVCRTSHTNTKKYKRGETFIQYDWIAEHTGATKDQIKKCISWLKEKGMVSTARSTRGVWIKVNKYEHFQTLDNYYSGVSAPDKAPEKLGTRFGTIEAPKLALEKTSNKGLDKGKLGNKKGVSALEKHQRSTREAPRYNKNEKNEKNITAKAVDETFSSSEYIKTMRAGNNKINKLIGWYFDTKKCYFPEKELIEMEASRWRRDAKFIIPFGNEKIIKTYNFVRNKFPEDWNLSTIKKYISQQ